MIPPVTSYRNAADCADTPVRAATGFGHRPRKRNPDRDRLTGGG